MTNLDEYYDLPITMTLEEEAHERMMRRSSSPPDMDLVQEQIDIEANGDTWDEAVFLVARQAAWDAQDSEVDLCLEPNDSQLVEDLIDFFEGTGIDPRLALVADDNDPEPLIYDENENELTLACAPDVFKIVPAHTVTFEYHAWCSAQGTGGATNGTCEGYKKSGARAAHQAWKADALAKHQDKVDAIVAAAVAACVASSCGQGHPCVESVSYSWGRGWSDNLINGGMPRPGVPKKCFKDWLWWQCKWFLKYTFPRIRVRIRCRCAATQPPPV